MLLMLDRRKLKTRINEHKNDINKKSGNLSVISECIDCNPHMNLIGVIPKFWIMRDILGKG